MKTQIAICLLLFMMIVVVAFSQIPPPPERPLYNIVYQGPHAAKSIEKACDSWLEPSRAACREGYYEGLEFGLHERDIRTLDPQLNPGADPAKEARQLSEDAFVIWAVQSPDFKKEWILHEECFELLHGCGSDFPTRTHVAVRKDGLPVLVIGAYRVTFGYGEEEEDMNRALREYYRANHNR